MSAAILSGLRANIATELQADLDGSMRRIARRLGISPATVKIHVARVTNWLGAANRTDAVARAQRGRII